MSATIPENMQLDDLLKATGYDCPEALQGKTFEEATEGGGGGAVLENNKKVTITENGTTIVTPTAGKDGMKKVTATVNVPSSATIKSTTITRNGTYTAPQGVDGFNPVTVAVSTDTYVKFNKGTPSGNANFWSDFASLIFKKAQFETELVWPDFNLAYMGVYVRQGENAFICTKFDTSLFSGITYDVEHEAFTLTESAQNTTCVFTLDTSVAKGAMLLNVSVTANGTYQATSGNIGMADGLSTVEVSVPLNLGSLTKIVADNKATANLNDEVSISMYTTDTSKTYVATTGDGTLGAIGSSFPSIALLSDIISAGASGVELNVSAGPDNAKVTVTATASASNTYTIKGKVTTAGIMGVVTSFGVASWY